MKRKTLLLAIAMMACAWGNLFAQKDVTSTYITNATLSNGTNGWTVSNFNAPQRGNNTTGYASEAYAGWGSLDVTSYSLTQTITLPAGHYTLVNYSFFRQGQNFNTDAAKSLAILKAGDSQVAVKTLGSITAPSYANNQAEGANVFDSKMYRNALDFTIDADGTQIEIGLVGTFDEMMSWCIAGMFELIDNDTPATMDSPFDVTGYITNPGFEYRDMSGWTVEPAGYFQTQNNNQGFKVGGYYAEKWQASGALPEGTMSQTISSLPAGYYKLTANLGGNGTFVDLNGKTAQWTADGNYTVGYVLAEGEDLTITAGKTAEGTANWIHFDNFKLQFCGDVAKALEDLIAQVSGYESKLPVDAYSQLAADVAAYDQTYTDVDELLAAIDAVQALYDKADALVPLVADYNAALERANVAAATTDKIWEQLRENLNSTIEAYDPMREQTGEAYTAATQALNEAAAAVETSIASYKIIASGEVPTNSLDGWVTTNTNTLQVNTWSKEEDGTQMYTPFIENWVYRDNVLGDGEVYYTLAGLQPGEVYFAQALVRAYSEAGNVPNGPNFFINDVETDMTAEGTAFTYNDMQGYFGTLGGVATVAEDGTIRLGVKISGANYNWVSFKNVAIQSMDDALQAAIDKVEAFYPNVPLGVRTACEQMIAGYDNLSTAAEYEAAIQALNTKADELPAIVLAYDKYLALKAVADELVEVESDDYMERNNLDKSAEAINDDVNAAIDQAAINAATESLRSSMVAYVNIASPTEGNQFNLTFMLTNPNLEGFTAWQPAEGWYTDRTTGNSQVMVNESVNSADGTKTAFYEYWSEAPAADDTFTLYQKVTLSAGIYNMSCYAFAQQPTGGDVRGVKFYANDTEGSTITSSILAPANIEFVNTEDGEVKVGLKGCAGNTYRWMGIGYVELYKLPKERNAVLSDDDTAAPAAGAYTSVTYDRTLLAGLNTLVLPFATTKEEIGASKVLVYEGDEPADDGKVSILFSEATTLSPNTPYVVFVDADTPLPVFENKTLIEPTDLTSAGTEYSFVGTYEAWTKNENSPIVNGDYVAGAKDFLKAKGGNGLKAYRAYLKKVGTASADGVNICIDGEFTDGIVAHELKQELGVENIYNLNGQKVSRTQKGVYIVNGRKVVVK